MLIRLAELYECRVADLVSDCADFRGQDSVYRAVNGLSKVPALLSGGTSASCTFSDDTGPLVINFSELVSVLASVDVHELARMTVAWADRVGDGVSRRALLLKLSAGLSLGAASPVVTDESVPVSDVPALDGSRFSGIWYSRYVYPSTGRGGDFTGDHFVVFRQQGSRLVGQSLPHSTGSQLRIELALDPPVATGSWHETTSPTGYYKGAAYHGTLQMVIDPSGRRMRGMWIGFGRNFTINSGRWELDLEENSTTKTVQRVYHMKA